MGFLDEWGGGGKTVSLTKIGEWVKGTVLGWDSVQQRDFDTQKPMTWDDGSPRMQLCIRLQTELRDDVNDDGVRRLFLKKGDPVTGGVGAIVGALKEAGVSELLTGGELTVQYVGDGTPSRAGMNPPKQYKAKFVPPTAAQQLDGDPFGLGDAAPQPVSVPVADELPDPF